MEDSQAQVCTPISVNTENWNWEEVGLTLRFPTPVLRLTEPKHPRGGTTHSRGRTVRARTGGQAFPAYTSYKYYVLADFAQDNQTQTPERMYKLKIYSTKFEQYMPSGERHLVVNRL